MIEPVHVQKDIRKARTLPSRVYHDPAYYQLQKETVFRRTWHHAFSSISLSENGDLVPWTLLPGCLDEPLFWSNEEVVEHVQRGVQSRLYDRGRYSPEREAGVHHFHRLLTEFMHSEERSDTTTNP